MGCLRFVAPRCGQLLAVPISRYSYPVRDSEVLAFCTPCSGTERGAFCLESGNPDIVRLVGRACRLG
ncbi:hypothetical protein C5B86_11900 [Haloferax sp. Atlit-19N]|nr:hypothetical protein C5B86_11900 [Haloferax sp. Atlit-19N]